QVTKPRLLPSTVLFSLPLSIAHSVLHSFPTRRSSDLAVVPGVLAESAGGHGDRARADRAQRDVSRVPRLGHRARHRLDIGVRGRSEEHTSELQSLRHLVCRLLLEKKMKSWLSSRLRST